MTNYGAQILSWASLLVVARLLAPKDFGIAAMAMILFPYLRFLGEFGIPQTLVTLRDLTEDQLAQLNTLAFLLGVGCFLISLLLARPMAAFFRTPALVPVVIVACISLIPLGWRAVPEGLLNKEMRFGLLSWFEAIRSCNNYVVCEPPKNYPPETVRLVPGRSTFLSRDSSHV